MRQVIQQDNWAPYGLSVIAPSGLLSICSRYVVSAQPSLRPSTVATQAFQQAATPIPGARGFRQRNKRILWSQFVASGESERWYKQILMAKLFFFSLQTADLCKDGICFAVFRYIGKTFCFLALSFRFSPLPSCKNPSEPVHSSSLNRNFASVFLTE